MIVIISKKDFLKNKKKLLKSGEYAICDTTGDSDIAELGAVKNCDEAFEDMDPPDSLIEGDLDAAKYEKKLNGYLKAPAHMKCVALACAAMLTHDGAIDPDQKTTKNVFIIFRTPVYKKLGKAIYKRWLKILDLDDEDGTVVVLFRKAFEQTKGASIDREDIEKQLKKLDKKINEMNEDLEAENIGYFDDVDIDKLREKLKKARKQREKYARALSGESPDEDSKPTDEMICDAIKGVKIPKQTRKKLAKYCLKYHKTYGNVNGRVSYYE